MRSYLFKNATVLTMQTQEVLKNAFVSVRNGLIEKIAGEEIKGCYDEIIDCKQMTLMPGLYNTHTHVPMAILRSVGEGLKLEDWLKLKIFPAEEKITKEIAYYGALLGIAEMVRFGTVSFSDMYFFSQEIAKAAAQSKMKANIARCITVFDEKEPLKKLVSVAEAEDLVKEYHLSQNGNIKIDLSLHSVYCDTLSAMQYVRDWAKKSSLRTHIHLSETQKENDDCFLKYRKSPTRVFSDEGFFDVPGIAAHCVYLSEEDMEILSEKGIVAVHNPVSNLKLASGIAEVSEMKRKGMTVSLGTDGCASNNNADLFEEIKMAALCAKIKHKDSIGVSPYDVLLSATLYGAAAQGREKCGMLKEGYSADMILLDTTALHFLPNNDTLSDIVYCAGGQDVKMTMVNGEMLYRDGEFLTLDIEKIRGEVSRMAKKIF